MDFRGAFLITLLVSIANAHSFYSSEENVVLPRGFFDNIANKVKDTAKGAVDTAKGTVNNVVDKAQEAAEKVKEEAEKAINQATSLADALKNLDVCSCQGTNCQCCAELKPTTNKLCFSLNFKLESFEIEYGLTINEKSLIKGGVSGKNPIPLCAPVVPPAISMCFKPYDLSISSQGFHACFQVEVKAVTKTVAAVNLNCFNFNQNSISMVPPSKPIEGGLVNLDVSTITKPIIKPGLKFPWW